MSLSAATLARPDYAEAPFDPLELRAAFGQFPQGVVVIGAEIDGEPEGMVISTFTVGVSLDPPLVSVAMQHSSKTWPTLRDRAPELGVSVIGARQKPLTRQIAGPDRANRFAGVDYTVDAAGALVLEDTPLWLKTRIHHQFTAGDHDVVILEVIGLGLDQTQPGMVFHQSTFKSLPADEA